LSGAVLQAHRVKTRTQSASSGQCLEDWLQISGNRPAALRSTPMTRWQSLSGTHSKHWTQPIALLRMPPAFG
jgi:hypothetical protein